MATGVEMKAECFILPFSSPNIGTLIDVRKVIQFEHVITGNRVSSLITIVALNIGKPTFRNAEKDPPVVVIQKKQIPEGGALAG